MPEPLRVLLIAPPDAAVGAVARLERRGPVTPARVPTAKLLEAALRQPWGAVLMLPGSEISVAEVAAALDAAAVPPLVVVEAHTCPPALAGAYRLDPGDTAGLFDVIPPTPETSAPTAALDPSATASSDAASPDAHGSPTADPMVTLSQEEVSSQEEASEEPSALTPTLLGDSSDEAFPVEPATETPGEAPAAPDTDELGIAGAAAHLADCLPIGLYRSTPDGRLLYGNPALADLLGQPSLDALYALDLRVDLGYPREPFAVLMAADGEVHDLITTWERPDGLRVHTRENARAERGPDGTVRVYAGTVEDVTDEVEARRTIEARARQHDAISRFAATAADLTDLSRLADEASLAAFDALGADWAAVVVQADGAPHVAWAGPLSAEVRDAPGTRGALADLCLDAPSEVPDAGRDALDALRSALKTESVTHIPILPGTLSHGALVVGYTDPARPSAEEQRGTETLAWLLANHVTRVRTECTLADLEVSLRHIVAHAGLVPYRQRLDGTYADLHPGIEALTGYPPDVVEASGGLDGLATHREVLRGQTLLDAPGAVREETLGIRYTVSPPDGAPRVVEVHAGPWRDASGEVIGWAGTYQNVTAHVEAEDALRGARDTAVEAADAARREAQQRTAALAELSHEIRTPLTGVIGFAEILAGELGAPHAEVAETILDGGQSMLATINAVLEHARLEASGGALTLVPTDLGVTVADAAERLRALAQEKGLALDVDVAADVVAALDERSVARIVTNLVGNAVKYTETGAVRVAVSTDGPDACLAVLDSGAGIPNSVREHLFEPFHAGDPAALHSTGLGLSIVKRLVDSLGGTISVEDRAPGTEVIVRFARLHPPASSSAQPTPSTMTHPLPSPSGDGQTDAADPRAPHEGDGHAAFVARPQPPEGAPPTFTPPGYAPPQGHAPPSPATSPAAPTHDPAPGYAPPHQGYAPAPQSPAPQGYAPPQQPPAAQGYAPHQPSYAPPHQGYAPAPQSPAPQGYAPPQQPPAAQGYAAPPAHDPSAYVAPYAAPAEVPAAPAAPSAPEAPPTVAEAAPASDKPRILVVEDNNDTRMLLDRILRRTYDVTAVGDARSALVAMHSGRFDGLVLDINLGGKETGADILRIARSLDGYQGVFAIALTAYALPGDRERLLEKGFSEYISKPFTRSSLMDALAKGVSV